MFQSLSFSLSTLVFSRFRNKIPSSFRRSKSSPLVLFIALFAFCQASHAALLFYENFDYTLGSTVNGSTLNGNGPGASHSWSGAWATNSMPGSGTGTVAANGLQVTPTSGTTTAYRPLGTTLNTLRGSETVLWLSYEVDMSLVGTRFFGLSLFSGYSSPSSGGSEILFMGKGSNAASTDNSGSPITVNGSVFNLASPPTSRSEITSVTAVAGQSYFLLTRMDFSAQTVTFYAMDAASVPATEAELTGGVTLSGTNVNWTSLGSVNAIRIGAGYTSGGSTTSAGAFDEIMIGTTYASVVPEPQSVLLLGTSAFFFGVMRRWQRRGSASDRI